MKPFQNIPKRRSFFLFLISLLSIGSIYIIKPEISKRAFEPGSQILESVELTEKWFNIIIAEKKRRNVRTDAVSNIKYKELLGSDFSTITTTLGSLEAKELSTNPDFAALITKYLLEVKINSNSTVGLIISGSFPALATAALASLQTLHPRVILFSSIGASSFGANQPDATWIDIENWLRENGGLIYHTNIVTPGGENDNGGGLTEEGLIKIQIAAVRNTRQIFLPKDLEESINTKLEILNKAEIDLLINIGGNQAGMGSCVHSLSIPNGLNTGKKICNCESRGILSRLSEKGIPYLQLLNVRDLALRNGIPMNPSIHYGRADVIDKNRINKLPIYILLLLLAGSLLFYRNYFLNSDAKIFSKRR